MRPAPTLLAIVALLAGSLTGLPAAAQDVLKRISARGQINVGYGEDSPPFSFKGDNGKPMGYTVDLCMLVVDRLRQELGKPAIPVKMIPVPTDQVARLVGSGGVDLMCAGVSDTAQRRATMAFSPPIFLSDVKMAVRAQDGFKSAADLRGKPVAVLGRTTTEESVKGFAVPLQVSKVVSADAALSQLRLGQASAWARDEVLLLGVLGAQPDKSKFTLLPDKLGTETIAIALRRDAGLQRVVDQGVALAVRGGQVDALYDKWFVKGNRANPNGLNLQQSAALKAEFDRLR